MVSARRRLILRCEVCSTMQDPEGILIEARPDQRAVFAAVDHMLDEHRAEFRFDPDFALRCIRVEPPSRGLPATAESSP